MTAGSSQLAWRLRQAREASGLSQEQVAGRLEVARVTITQIEQGRRSVSDAELQRFAGIYAKPVKWFYEPPAHEVDDEGVAALFRAAPELEYDDAIKVQVERYAEIAREMRQLEDLLLVVRDVFVPAGYALDVPRSKWDAIQQGSRVAREERRRLDLGDAPIGDFAELLDTQGIRAVSSTLPEDVSGVTIRQPDAGPIIIVNKAHLHVRQRFSFAHEYAHVLLDRGHTGIVSRASQRNEILEIRANAFAASFLLPASAVRGFAASVGKGLPSRLSADVFDEEGVVNARRRVRPRSQSIQIYDVVQLAARYGVSHSTALYRLKNVRPPLVSDDEFARLKRLVDSDAPLKARAALGFPDSDKREHESPGTMSRFVALAVEAYRQKQIDRAWLQKVARLANADCSELERLAAGMEAP